MLMGMVQASWAQAHEHGGHVVAKQGGSMAQCLNLLVPVGGMPACQEAASMQQMVVAFLRKEDRE